MRKAPSNPYQTAIDFESLPQLLTPDEMYDRATTARVLQGWKEDRRIERKTANIQPKELGEYFSMWANTPPDGGLIVAGMEDKGSVSGCHHLSTDNLNNLEKTGYTYCPEARHLSKRIPATTVNGDQTFLVLFKVDHCTHKVVRTVSGKAFIRQGDEKHTLTEEEIRELSIDRGEVQYEEEPVDLKYPDDFNMDMVQLFVSNLRTQRKAPHLSDVECLTLRRLGKMKNGRFRPNVACALLFAKDPVELFPGCKVRFLRFEGEYEGTGEDYNVVKSEFIEGPISFLIDETARILESQLRQFSRLGKDGHFYTVPEYPKEAWFEALVNACVHRSYSLKNMHVFVKMFDDHLEIESPGGFPPLVTPENIYHMQVPRNPRLMNALYYMELTREHNEGTNRMRRAMVGMHLPPPEFKQSRGGAGFAKVKVTLRNDQKQRKSWVDADAGKILGEAIAQTLSAEDLMVVNYVAVNKSIDASKCLHQIPTLSRWHNAQELLMSLAARGVLLHHRPVKPRSYQCFTFPNMPRPARVQSRRRRAK
jgi:ATP-dependent DNA helicase RecG